MEGIDVYRMDTGAGPSFSEGSDTNNFVSGLILSNNISYNLHSFAWESVHLEKNLSSKCGVENNIFLYMMLQVILIVLIPDEYYQFRT